GERPTAWPNLAARAAILGTGLGPARDRILLLLLNVRFSLPLLAILATLTFGGDQADRMIATGRPFLQRHWPSVLAGFALAAGLFVVLLGLTGLAATHNHLLRRLHQTLHG